jgi:hypothetical protein
MTMKKIIVVPCIVIMRLKTWGELIVRNDQLYPHDGGFNTANYEKYECVDDVENTQLLVVDGDDPIVKPFADWPANLGGSRDRNCFGGHIYSLILIEAFRGTR